MTAKDHNSLIVLGLDADGKPHGSRFSEADSELVEKAASLMGFSAVRVTDSELRKVAAQLPEGRVFGSGRAFVPFVKRAVYDQLATLIHAGAAQASQSQVEGAGDEKQGGDAEQENDATTQPGADPWAEIGVGELVLCADEEGWWEAVVVAAAGPNDPLTLRWRDFPKEPRFEVPRRKVAVIGRDAR